MSPDAGAAHHYVPEWYQRRFIPLSQRDGKYYYFDKTPPAITLPNGRIRRHNDYRFLGPPSCFQERELYTLRLGKAASDVIERQFFGTIDRDGANAVEHFSDYAFNADTHDALQDLLDYMGAQRLRTPKALDFLKKTSGASSHTEAVALMRRLFEIYKTVWMEAVWEVLNADTSPTKFIVSDTPVTTYNRDVFPRSVQCPYPFDAAIEQIGTHTVFPLSPTRCLVLTNLNYVRDPWATRTRSRTNARSYQQTVWSALAVQLGRQLDESDVRSINFILKTCARRYIAASNPEWLYPERAMRTMQWNRLGDDFFLMPDPRKLHFTTGMSMGYKDGSSWSMDEYGRAYHKGPAAEAQREAEWDTFRRHQELWEQKRGPLTDEEIKHIW